MPIFQKNFLSVALLFTAFVFCFFCPPPLPAQKPSSEDRFANLLHSFVVDGKTIDTKTYLDQAWETKGRPGLFANGGMNWDPLAREWTLMPAPSADFFQAVA